MTSAVTAQPEAFRVTPVEPLPASAFNLKPPKTTSEVIAEVAYQVSYFTSLILTADRMYRSAESVLESMRYTQEETILRLDMSPASRGFKVMLLLDRPIDF